jgi:hypothetical protein
VKYFDEKGTLKAGKEALTKQAREMFECAGSLGSVTLNARVDGVAYELCCHDVLGWDGEESEDIDHVLSWLESATFDDLYDYHESQVFVFYERDSHLLDTLRDYHEGVGEPSPEKLDDYVCAYNAIPNKLSRSGCSVEYSASGEFSDCDSIEQIDDGWGWFMVNNPDTASTCYAIAQKALHEFHKLLHEEELHFLTGGEE